MAQKSEANNEVQHWIGCGCGCLTLGPFLLVAGIELVGYLLTRFWPS